MFFYLLFTLALWLRKDVFRFIGIALTLLTVGAYFRRPSWPPVAFYLDTIVIEFYFGMLIAQAIKHRRMLPPPIAVVMLLGGFALLIFDSNFPMSVPRGLVLGVPAAMMLLGITSLEQYLSNVPKLILYLADASYVIYLFHPFVAAAPAAIMVKLHHEHFGLAVILGFFISLLAGAAAHEFVEKPTALWFRNHVRVRNRKVIHVS
jgi:peptidoglycan/LPS O-acetylase OafA/YrhL